MFCVIMVFCLAHSRTGGNLGTCLSSVRIFWVCEDSVQIVNSTIKRLVEVETAALANYTYSVCEVLHPIILLPETCTHSLCFALYSAVAVFT